MQKKHGKVAAGDAASEIRWYMHPLQLLAFCDVFLVQLAVLLNPSPSSWLNYILAYCYLVLNGIDLFVCRWKDCRQLNVMAMLVFWHHSVLFDLCLHGQWEIAIVFVRTHFYILLTWFVTNTFHVRCMELIWLYIVDEVLMHHMLVPSAAKTDDGDDHDDDGLPRLNIWTVHCMALLVIRPMILRAAVDIQSMRVPWMASTHYIFRIGNACLALFRFSSRSLGTLQQPVMM